MSDRSVNWRRKTGVVRRKPAGLSVYSGRQSCAEAQAMYIVVRSVIWIFLRLRVVTLNNVLFAAKEGHLHAHTSEAENNGHSRREEGARTFPLPPCDWRVDPAGDCRSARSYAGLCQRHRTQRTGRAIDLDALE